MKLNENYHQELAQRLIDALGIAQAIETAKANHWDAVLALVEGKPNGSPADR